MGIFNSLGQKPVGLQAQNPQQALAQLKSNPAATLKQAGLNIPEGMTDPGAIIQHLLQSGQINNSRLQMAQRMAGAFRR